MCLGSVGLRLEPTELEEQETAPREAGSGQNMQGLGSHTKNPGFHAKGKGSEQSDTARLMFYIILAAVCTIHCRKEEAGRKERRLE